MMELRWRTTRLPDPPDGSRLLCAGFVLLIALVPFCQLAADGLQRRLPHLVWLFVAPPTVEHLHSWEDQLERESLVAEAVRPPVMLLQAALLRRGNEKVVIGDDGWLFYRPGLGHVVGPPVSPVAGEGRPLTAIVSFRDALAARGIELVVLPVPDKVSLYPDKLLGSLAEAPAPPRNAGELALFEALRAQGVRVVDPAPLLWAARDAGEPLYLPRDTHWTPRGLMLVCEAVAAAVREVRPRWQGLPARETVEVGHRGDLYDMLDLPADTLYAPSEVTVPRPVGLSPPESPAQMVVLGDSFTNIYSDETLEWGAGAGLAEQLAAELGRSYDVIALNDGGVNGSRARLAQQPERLERARLVVWQFAVRDLSIRADDWQVIPLAEVE